MAITVLQAQRELRRRAAVSEFERRQQPQDKGVRPGGIVSIPVLEEIIPPEKPTLPPRQFRSTIDEFTRALGRGTLNVGSGLLRSFAQIGEGSLFNVERINELADKAREASQSPTFQPGTDGGVRGFIANAVGDAGAFMAATIGATLVGGPVAGFSVAFAVEGGNAYEDALDAGASQQQAETEGFVVGSINAALELLQVEKVIKFAKVGKGSVKAIAKAAKDKALKKIAKLGAKAGKEAIKLSITEGVQEALQETTSVLAPALTGRQLPAFKEAVKRIGQAGLGGAVAGPILGGGGAVTSAVTSALRQEAAQEVDILPDLPAEHSQLEENLTKRIMEEKGVSEEVARAAAKKGIQDKFFPKEEVPPPITEAVDTTGLPPITEKPTVETKVTEKPEITPPVEAEKPKKPAKPLPEKEVTAKKTQEAKAKEEGQANIEALNTLERFEGVELKVFGSIIGTGKKGIKAKPHDIDIVFDVTSEVYFNHEHPFWEQADALSNQEGKEVWIRSPAEVSILQPGKGNPVQRLTTVGGQATKSIEQAVPIEEAGRIRAEKLEVQTLAKELEKSLKLSPERALRVAEKKLALEAPTTPSEVKEKITPIIEPKKAVEKPKVAEEKLVKPTVAKKPPKVEPRPPEQTTTEKTLEIQKKVVETVETDFTQATAAKQKSLAEDRETMGLDEINSPDRRSWEESLKKAVDEKIPSKANRIAEEVNAAPRPLSDVETAGLVQRLAELKNEHKAAMEDIGETKDGVEVKTQATLIDRIEAEFDALTRALNLSGTEKGRALAAQKLTINRDFDLISVLNRAKAAAGKKLTAIQKKIFSGLTEKLKKTNKRVEVLEGQVNELQAKTTIVRGTKRFKTMTLQQKDTNLQNLTQKAKQLLESGCAN